MVQATLAKPTTGGRLYPTYDEEAQILSLSSEEVRDWPYGVDIDGTLIFDLDASRVLANVDLLVPRNMWRTDTRIGRPDYFATADVVFMEATVRYKSFHMPLDVTTNTSGTLMSISFGEIDANTLGVELSRGCMALFGKNTLVGFQVEVSAIRHG